MKPHVPYCDYCGEVIHNYHKIEVGDDIIIALQTRQMEKDVFKRTTTFGRIIALIAYAGICFAYFPFTLYPRLCFCNERHKDLFAKQIGLRIKRG